MQSFLLLVFGLAVVGACIWFLHRIQLRRTVENADLTAPLDALGESGLPDFERAAPQPASLAPTEVPAEVVPFEVHEHGHASAPDLAPDVAPATEDAGVPEASTAPEPDVASTFELPASATNSTAVVGATPATNDSWLAQIRGLRDKGELDAALALSRAQFPKTQAFQQAAIILRQQIREALEKFQPVDALLLDLYHTAALADLFRTSSSHKPHDAPAALAAVRAQAFQYAALGHLRLKLLNKSDVRALEQLWGAPAAHRHTEDLLGEDWLKRCRAP